MLKFCFFKIKCNGIHRSEFPFLRFLLIIISILISLSILTGCSKEEKEEYLIRIVDIDDEVIGEKKIEVDKYSNVYECLISEFDTVGEMQEYGAYITSINNSIIDENWSLMCYINGVEANNSCDKIIPNKEDIIEFKNVCWASIDYGYGVKMDEYDVLVDKAIYHYLKNTMKEKLESIKTFKESSYWEMLTLDLYKRANLDLNVIDYKFSEELINDIVNHDINLLDGVDIGKYYIHAKNLNKINENFSDVLINKINELEEWNDYITPFIIFPASDFGICNETLIKLANSDINGTNEWGPTGNLWKVTCQSLFADRSDAIELKDYVVEWKDKYDFGSNCDNCLVLLAASALGVNIRDVNEFGTINYNNRKCDYLEYIMTRYYDEERMILKVYDEDITFGMSSNQVYASLLAYKIFNNTNKPTNIFGKENRNIK